MGKCNSTRTRTHHSHLVHLPSTFIQHLPFIPQHPPPLLFLPKTLPVLSGLQGFFSSSTASCVIVAPIAAALRYLLLITFTPLTGSLRSCLHPWGPLRSPSFLQIRRSQVFFLVDWTRLAALPQPARRGLTCFVQLADSDNPRARTHSLHGSHCATPSRLDKTRTELASQPAFLGLIYACSACATDLSLLTKT